MFFADSLKFVFQKPVASSCAVSTGNLEIIP